MLAPFWNQFGSILGAPGGLGGLGGSLGTLGVSSWGPGGHLGDFGRHLEGLGCPWGLPRALLGRLWASFGFPLGPFGRHLASLWDLLDTSWTSFSRKGRSRKPMNLICFYCIWDTEGGQGGALVDQLGPQKGQGGGKFAQRGPKEPAKAPKAPKNSEKVALWHPSNTKSAPGRLRADSKSPPGGPFPGRWAPRKS
jgi:hypothetical protein